MSACAFDEPDPKFRILNERSDKANIQMQAAGSDRCKKRRRVTIASVAKLQASAQKTSALENATRCAKFPN
jgi:hypothetical protein